MVSHGQDDIQLTPVTACPRCNASSTTKILNEVKCLACGYIVAVIKTPRRRKVVEIELSEDDIVELLDNNGGFTEGRG